MQYLYLYIFQTKYISEIIHSRIYYISDKMCSRKMVFSNFIFSDLINSEKIYFQQYIYIYIRYMFQKKKKMFILNIFQLFMRPRTQYYIVFIWQHLGCNHYTILNCSWLIEKTRKIKLFIQVFGVDLLIPWPLPRVRHCKN